MLRLTNNVPEIYVNESRDFQLLCRLYDSANQGIKYRTLKMLDMLTASSIDNRILSLLADRVGFKYNGYIDDKVLRYIVAAFPYIIKNKGTKLGVEQAIITVLKAENSVDLPYVSIDNDYYTIDIITPISLYNQHALEELLKYIIPTGYIYNITRGYSVSNASVTEIIIRDNLIAVTSSDENKFAITRSSSDEYSSGTEYTVSTTISMTDDEKASIKNSLIGAVGTEVVAQQEEWNETEQSN